MQVVALTRKKMYEYEQTVIVTLKWGGVKDHVMY